MLHILKKEKGMALLITIMIVSLLVVVTSQFGRSMYRELVSSANLKDSSALDAMAQSGVNLAVELLRRDSKNNAFDSYQDVWGKIGNEDLSFLFDRGKLTVTVEDLSGRLQVNSLVASQGEGSGVDAATAKKLRDVLKRLLLSGNFAVSGEDEADGIVDALTDWIDKDDLESDHGAEDSYYRSLEHPYGCKNGPVSTLEELLLVKGITPELFYGTKDRKGLAQFLTVYGKDGKININTADPVLLQALDGQMTPDLVKKIVEYRDGKDNWQFLATIDWYKKISSWPGDVGLDGQLITTQSRYFKITAVGILDSLKRTRTAIVSRDEKNGESVLYMKVE